MSAAEVRKVAIVDDAVITRKVLRMLMTNEGYDVVVESGDAQEAMRLIELACPGIVFLDIYLRGGNGLDLLKLIRKRLPATHVIMISTDSDKEVVQTALQNGAFGFLPKPFSGEGVSALVKQVITAASA